MEICILIKSETPGVAGDHDRLVSLQGRGHELRGPAPSSSIPAPDRWKHLSGAKINWKIHRENYFKCISVVADGPTVMDAA